MRLTLIYWFFFQHWKYRVYRIRRKSGLKMKLSFQLASEKRNYYSKALYRALTGR